MWQGYWENTVPGSGVWDSSVGGEYNDSVPTSTDDSEGGVDSEDSVPATPDTPKLPTKQPIVDPQQQMNFNELNSNNFTIFAIKYYDNPTASTSEEFQEDLRRFKYVKRWLKKYHETGDMNSHLLLNHIIVIFNCWNDAAIPMFFHKTEVEYWPYLKSFFVYLNRVPVYPLTELHEIQLDDKILKQLIGL